MNKQTKTRNSSLCFLHQKGSRLSLSIVDAEAKICHINWQRKIEIIQQNTRDSLTMFTCLQYPSIWPNQLASYKIYNVHVHSQSKSKMLHSSRETKRTKERMKQNSITHSKRHVEKRNKHKTECLIHNHNTWMVLCDWTESKLADQANTQQTWVRDEKKNKHRSREEQDWTTKNQQLKYVCVGKLYRHIWSTARIGLCQPNAEWADASLFVDACVVESQ